MGSELEYLKQQQKELFLVARTGALSPADVSTFLQLLQLPQDPLVLASITGFTEAVVGRVFEWVNDSIRSRQKGKKERNELLRSLFGYCRNADFFVGKKQRGMSNIDDLKAAIEILRLCIGTFGEKPEWGEKKDNTDINFESNLVCVGDIKNNPVSAYSFQQVMKLPYKFTFEQGHLVLQCQNKETILVPEYYSDKQVWVKDYATISQVANIVPNSRLLGRKMLVISGTTPPGTWGAALAIKERDEILNEIWAETKGRDFQAILSIDLENKEPVNMSLLDIKQL